MPENHFITDDKTKDIVWRAPFFTLTVLIAAPVIINECYNADWGFSTLWNAADMLQYVGVAASGFGTIALSYFTVVINKRIQNDNQEMMKIAERSLTREERSEVPLIDFSSVTEINGKTCLKAEFLLVDNMYRIRFWVFNGATYGIKNIRIVEAILAPVVLNNHVIQMDQNYLVTFSAEKSNQTKVSILPNQEAIICVYFPYLKFPMEINWFYVHAVFENENNMGQKLRETVNISFRGKCMAALCSNDEWPHELLSKEVQYEWC